MIRHIDCSVTFRRHHWRLTFKIIQRQCTFGQMSLRFQRIDLAIVLILFKPLNITGITADRLLNELLNIKAIQTRVIH
ncbi:hypothetical protein SRABI106_04078 [Rahnella aquatilis]|nr:hypothetical protein SRABI106_04078 [Rahnella aquatilis]